MAATLCDVLCEALDVEKAGEASHPYSQLYHKAVLDAESLQYMRPRGKRGWEVIEAEKLLRRVQQLRRDLSVNREHEDEQKITVREYVKRQLGTQLLAMPPNQQRRVLGGYCAKLLKEGLIPRQQKVFSRSNYYLDKNDSATRAAVDEALARYGQPKEQKRDFYYLLQDAVREQLGLTGPRRDVRVTNLFYVLRDDEKLRPYLSKHSNRWFVRPAAEQLLVNLVKQGSSYASFMPTADMQSTPPLKWSALPDDYIPECNDSIKKHKRLDPEQEKALFAQLLTSRNAFLSTILRNPERAAELGREIALLLDKCTGLSDWSALFQGNWALLTEKAEYWPRISGELAHLAAQPRTTTIEDRVEAIYRRFGFRQPRLAALAVKYADGESRPMYDAYSTVRTTLFESQKRLARFLTRNTFNSVYGRFDHPQAEDALAEAERSVLSAIDRFEPSLGVRLSVYARWWIRKGISDVIHKSHIVHMPEKIHRLSAPYTLAARLFQHEHLREPTAIELADLMHIRKSTAKTLLEFPQTWDLEVRTDEDKSWEECIVIDEPEAIEHDIWQCAQTALTSTEYQVLHGHIADDKTYDQLSGEIGKSAERARQIYGVALAKLRESGVFDAYK